MIVAMSRFRVANGMEAEVRRAFEARPRLVDGVPGFLGLEVFTDSREPGLFVLQTRWSDEPSFRAWHRSEAHARSHRLIPRGLELDPSETEVRVLEPIPTGPVPERELATAEAAWVLARALASSEALAVVSAQRDGTIRWANRAFEQAVGVADAQLAGHPVSEWLTAPDAARLGALLAPGARQERTRLNFASAAGVVVTLACTVSVRASSLLVVGEPVVQDERSLQRHLLSLNDELAASLRENTRVGRELAAAKDELDRSYWHLRKIQEVLPICMECGKVRTSETRWEEVVTYLKNNSLFLSHGYCPECASKLEGGLE
jgi:heme-degrading monooxygenase HmoA